MAFLRNEKGEIIRKDGTVAPRPIARRGPGAARASVLKVDQILGAAGPLRDEYERLLNTPGTYLRHLHDFLKQHGHDVCIAAIKTHRARHREGFKKVRDAAEMAAAFCEITRRHGGETGSFVEAAQGHFEMKLMQQLSKIAEDEKLPPERWQAWGRTLRDMATSRRTVEALRADYERRAAEAAKAVETMDPKEAHAELVDRVRTILGVNLSPGNKSVVSQ